MLRLALRAKRISEQNILFPLLLLGILIPWAVGNDSDRKHNGALPCVAHCDSNDHSLWPISYSSMPPPLSHPIASWFYE